MLKAATKDVTKRARVIILGTGWAGNVLARKLDKTAFDVRLVSPANHFLFTPLLPSTAVGTLEFRAIQEPVRTIPGLSEYYQAKARKLNLDQRTVTCEDIFSRRHFDVAYDYLVVATGCKTNTFATPGVAAREGRDVFFLKHLHHARAIRNRVLECFERASNPTMTAAQRSALCSFVVVGGGATSCEFATELSDFLRDDVSRWYPELAKHHTSITIVEAGPRILGTFDAALVDYYEKHLRSRNISLRLDTAIKAVEDNPTAAAASASEAIPATTASVGKGERAELPGSTPIDNGSGGLASLSDGSSLPFGCLVWSAGLAPVKFVEQLPPSSTSASRSLPKGFGRNGAGRLVVDQYLRLPGTGGRVFSAGDCAVEPARECPMTANTAEQQGAYLAKCFNQYYKHRPGNTLRIVGENGLQKKGQAPSEQGTALGGSFCPGLVCDPPGPVIPSGMPFDLLEPLNALLFSPSAEFRYVERGKMVSMGLGKGIADLSNSQLLGDTIGPLPGGSGNAGPATLKGWAAFVSWRAAYLSKQLSWGNRLLVPMFWFKSWAFGRDISRF